MNVGILVQYKNEEVVKKALEEVHKVQGVIYKQGNFKDNIRDACRVAESLNVFILDIDITDEKEFLQGVREFRISDTKSNTRIIILATNRKKGDISLSRLMKRQVFDFCIPDISDCELEDEKEKVIFDALVKMLSSEAGTYFTARDFEIDEEEYAANKINTIIEKPVGNVSISILGAKNGVGCTHVSLQIASLILNQKFKVAVVELNSSNAFKDITRYSNDCRKRNENGTEIASIYGIDIYPYYKDINLKDIFGRNYAYIVFDFGSYEDSLKEFHYLDHTATIRVLVSGSQFWHISKLLDLKPKFESYNSKILLNLASVEDYNQIKKKLKKDEIFINKFSPDPFESVVELGEVLTGLLPIETEQKETVIEKVFNAFTAIKSMLKTHKK